MLSGPLDHWGGLSSETLNGANLPALTVEQWKIALNSFSKLQSIMKKLSFFVIYYANRLSF